MRGVSAGIVAGATGTLALDIASYIDMVTSGRAASETPAKLVEAMAKSFGFDSLTDDSDEAKNRRSALGAVLGYANGLSFGIVHGLFNGVFRHLPWPIEGVIIALASTAATDALYAKYDVADPTTYTPSVWAYDIGFHLVYGLVTAATLRAIVDTD